MGVLVHALKGLYLEVSPHVQMLKRRTPLSGYDIKKAPYFTSLSMLAFQTTQEEMAEMEGFQKTRMSAIEGFVG